MTVPAVVITWRPNPDGTVTATWPADSDANIDEYLVSVDGQPAVTTHALSAGPLPGNVAHTVYVTPTAGDAQTAQATYTPTTTGTLKAPIRGLLDRSKAPNLSFLKAHVVDAPMSAFWDGVHGHPLIHPNPLDTALRGTWLLKLRASRAGGAPTAMKTLAGFHPVTVTDTADGATTTVGPFWRADYLALYAEYQQLLAAEYDSAPLLREVVMAEPALVYDEPFRQYGSPGWTLAELEASWASMYTAHKAWSSTLQDLAFNPFSQDAPFTEAQVTAVRAALGHQVVLGNNSLRASSMGTAYDAMYAAIQAAGGPIYFQTAGFAKMGDFNATMVLAQRYGAGSVELPNYSAIPVTLLEQWETALGG